MNKKNIGAAFSVLAAISAGATVYASTMNNLDSDKNTNSIIKPHYTDNIYDQYSLAKSDYTKDIKNTSISNEKREVKKTDDSKVEVLQIEVAAKELVLDTITAVNENGKDEEEYPMNEESLENVEDNQENLEDSTEELVDNDQTNQALEESFSDQLETSNEKDLNNQSYSNNETTKANDNTNQQVNEIVSKFVNTKALNIRSSKDFANFSNIVNTITAGQKIDGSIDGDWLRTDYGYVSLAYLSDYYPKALLDSINAENENEEINQENVNEANQENSKELENHSTETTEESQIVNENAQTEENRTNENYEEFYGQAFTGWVANSQGINVRNKPNDGQIIGVLGKNTKVVGEISNGWVKFDYNGSKAYASSYYMSTSEVLENSEAVEEVKQEQEIVKEEAVKEEQTFVTNKNQNLQVNANGSKAAGIACQFAGYPYVWGGANPSSGFDCSGLVVYAYKQLGISLPHLASSQMSAGYSVDFNNLQAGDLIFFSMKGNGIDHVGIITSSDGSFIHASSPNTGVKYDNLYNSYYKNYFKGARRIF